MTSVEQVAELQRLTGLALIAAVEARAIGLIEISTAAKLANQVRTGRGLTTEDARLAWRILDRNKAKLAEHGIELPGAKPAAPPPVVRPASSVTVVSMREDGYIGVSDAPMELNDVFRNALHSRWDPRERQWPFAPTPAYAAALLTALDGHEAAVSPAVLALAEQEAARVRARPMLNPNAPVPTFDYSGLIAPGAEVWEHQARAVEFVAASSATLLAMPMGSGKTAATVWAANRMRSRRVVIFCPNKVRGVWPREIAKWSSLGWHVVDGKRPAQRRGAPPQDLKVEERVHQAERNLFDCPCNAVIHAAVFNYEMLVHDPLDAWVPDERIDLVVFDEIHRLKSPQGKMSKTAARWVEFTDNRIGLTGTPMPQYPWDIFGVLRALDPGVFGPIWTSFKSKFIEMKVREDDGKAFPVAIVKEYRAEFTESVHRLMYRPEVDLKLPPVKHIMRPIELEPAARREYARLDAELWADLRPFEAVDPDREGEVDKTLTPKNVLARMMRQMQFTGGTVPDDDGVKTRVSTAKVQDVEDALEEIGCVAGKPGGPEPVIVYCQFRDDLDVIRDMAARLKLRYREISGRKSDGLTQLSEMHPDCDVVGVQIQSGGTGVDLTRASYGLWYSVGHSLGDYDQALKRQNRPGQKHPVTFLHFVARDTVDEKVYAGLAARRSVVGSFLLARGINPAMAGLSPEDGAVMTLDEIEDEFNRQREAEGGGERRRRAGVSLPTDDFGRDVRADPLAPAHGKRPGPEEPSAETIEAFDLDAFF